MDYRTLIVSELNVLRKKEQQEGNTFKVVAYSKVIGQIQQLPKVESMEDLREVKGIGKSILPKLEEIFETGKLKAAQEARKDKKMDIVDAFMNIYGVGRVKAQKLVTEEKMGSIEELRKGVEARPSLLNENQKVGLLYYEDFLERIPREEMVKHEKKITKMLHSVSKDLEMVVVGSYRRGEPSSGDIDVLIKWPSHSSAEQKKKTLEAIVQHMTEDGYVTDTLALGEKKFMGVCKIQEGAKARRLDLLLTPEREYGFAIMYFTGSDKFNVAVRKVALEKGYSMNEHGFTPKEGAAAPPLLGTEEDIFRFLGFQMIPPKERKDGKILDKKKL